jgi:3'(2'), 5'-bisphosphate nucleotidase
MTYLDIDIDKLLDIARRAGTEIMQVYARDFGVDIKEDNSPLTEADRLSNKVIVESLQSLYPGTPIISEENKTVPYSERKDWSSFWLVDPLDGTKEFIKRNGEFTVNIAWIENGVPKFGVVYAPAMDLLYYGIEGKGSFIVKDGKAELLEPKSSYLYIDEITVVASRSHMSEETIAFVKELENQGKKIEFKSSGSSLKFCLVAEGSADVYPRFGPTMEWDTGAAHAVALYAGKDVLDANTGKPLTYNKENLLNPFFIVG